MFKWLRQAIDGIRVVLKYASLIMVILSILGYSADQLEEWQNKNDPAKKAE